MSERISLNDVARACSLSVSSISLALRNAGTLSVSTRRRIKATARRLGYKPNPLLASLASKRFQSTSAGGIPIAYLHCRERVSLYGMYSEQFQAVQQYARERGFHLRIFYVDDFGGGAHATRVLFSRGVQGIILSPLIQAGMLPGMDWTHFSVVGWGESMPETVGAPLLRVPRTNVDHFHSVLQAWAEVAKRGYRRIGVALFVLRPGSTDDLLRWGAAKACQLNLSPPQGPIPPFTPSQDSGPDPLSNGFKEWLDLHRPDAVIGFNALHLFDMRHCGYRVPEDVGFASLHAPSEVDPTYKGGEREAGLLDCRIRMMRATIDLLDQQIRYHQYGLPDDVRLQLIQREWSDGDTLPDRSVSSRSQGPAC